MFEAAADLDAYLKFFVASMAVSGLNNWRAFVTNDNIDFEAVDHFVLMDEEYGLGINKDKVSEINLKDIKKDIDKVYSEANAKREAAKKAAQT
tara:strand:- start:881 stop:1159 length:279 start_codon:yes stop_codon:yes gene_type:complete